MCRGPGLGLGRESLFVLLLSLVIGGGTTGCGPGRAEEAAEDATTGFVATDVTDAAGLGNFRHFHGGFGRAWAPEINGGGGGFFDYDGDGWVDILLVPGSPFRGMEGDTLPAVRIYRNNGDGTFEERTRALGLYAYRTYGYGPAMGDYDNDGDEDVFLSSLYEDMLFRNDGDRFTEVGSEAGLANEMDWGESSMFIDLDRDGWLDLYVTNYIQWTPETDIVCADGLEKVYCTPQAYDGVRSRFYHNNGDGTFSDWTDRAGFAVGIEAERDKALGVTALDYNRDGWPDIMVSNDTERDLLYENNGDGTVTERGIMAGVAYNSKGVPRAGMGIDVGVIDDSGEETIVVGNFTEESVGVYRHLGKGVFSDIANVAKVGHNSMMTLTFGIMLLDLDLDGDLDLFAANGHVQQHIAKLVHGVTFEQQPQVYLNNGNGLFEEQINSGGALAQPLVARAAAHGDIDRDGDLDLLLVENDGPARLYRNDTKGGGFLVVALKATKSNRSAIGARVRAYIGGRWREQRIRSGSSYLSQHQTIATFGLGDAPAIDSLHVAWPSGLVDRLGRIEGNQQIRVEEGTAGFEPWKPKNQGQNQP